MAFNNAQLTLNIEFLFIKRNINLIFIHKREILLQFTVSKKFFRSIINHTVKKKLEYIDRINVIILTYRTERMVLLKYLKI